MDTENIDVKALNPFYRTLSELVGVEGMVKLFESYCGGTFSFPDCLYDAEFVIGKVVQEFNGTNTNLLARKYGYSDQWLRIQLWQHGCGDQLLLSASQLNRIPVIEGELSDSLLQPLYCDLYQLLGSNKLKWFYMAFRGSKVEFPPYLYDADLAAKAVVSQYNGYNKKKLVLRYGYSKWWVKDVLKAHRKPSETLVRLKRHKVQALTARHS